MLIEERLNTYIEPIQEAGLDRIAATGELIWWSERDGWGHYYLYGTGGKLKNRVTGGEFNAAQIAAVDAAPEPETAPMPTPATVATSSRLPAARPGPEETGS